MFVCLLLLLLFVCLCLGEEERQRFCAPSDYLPQYGPCLSNNTRTLAFVRSNCEIGPKVLHSSVIGCECTPNEYIPVFGPCIDGKRQSLGYNASTGCKQNPTLLLPSSTSSSSSSSSSPPAVVWTMCLCTDSDIVSDYTKCDSATGTQSVVHYYNNPNCLNPNNNNINNLELLLPPTKQMPCDLSCDAGSFLAPPHVTCALCPAGTFSARIVKFDAWDELLPGFHTTCVGAFCEPWQLHGEFISSGHQDHSGVMSTLQWRTTLAQPEASLTVTYRVESQFSWDYFAITVNGAKQQIPWETSTGINEEWLSYSFDLHQHECDAEVVFHELEHCVQRNYFTPSSPQFGKNPLKGIAFMPLDKVGCEQEAFPSQFFAGKFAIVLRGNCTFVTKVTYAQNAGAIGVLLVNYEESVLQISGFTTNVFIPVGVVSFHAGNSMMQSIAAGEEIALTVRQRVITDALVEFSYSKWANSAPRTYAGADRAFIKSITATGIAKTAKKCDICPPGTFSPTGATTCTPCPANHFSSHNSSAECTPCPFHHTSLSGSITCQLSVNCTQEDYYVKLGVCTRNSLGALEQTVQLVSVFDPPVCSGGLQPQLTPTTQSCESCGPGMWRSADSQYQCAACAEGKFLSSNGCESCSPGTAAIRELIYNDFIHVPPFEMVCNNNNNNINNNANGGGSTAVVSGGNCLSKWSLMTHLDNEIDKYVTVYGVTGGVRASQLVLKEEIYTSGFIDFQYFYFTNGIIDSNDGSSKNNNNIMPSTVFEIKRLDKLEPLVQLKLLPDPVNPRTYVSLGQHALHSGRYEFTWITNCSGSDTFALRSLHIRGANSGGSVNCSSCTKGMYCTGTSKPTPCSAGHVSSGTNSSKCDLCPSDSVSNVDHSQCETCIGGTVPDKNQNICLLPNCKLHFLNNNTFGKQDLITYDFYWLDFLSFQDGFELTDESKPNTKSSVRAQYTLGLCASIANKKTRDGDRVCPDANGDPAIACQSVERAPPVVLASRIDMSLANWHHFPPAPPSLTLVLTDGHECESGFNNNNNNDKSSQRSRVVLNFLCNPFAAEAVLNSSVNVINNCLYHITFSSFLSCPQCTADHLVELRTPCVNGKQVLSYQLKQGAMCALGKSNIEMVCSNMSVSVSLGFNAFTVALTFLIVLVGGLVMSLFHVISKHRELYVNYARVLARDGEEELTETVPCAQEDSDDERPSHNNINNANSSHNNANSSHNNANSSHNNANSSQF